MFPIGIAAHHRLRRNLLAAVLALLACSPDAKDEPSAVPGRQLPPGYGAAPLLSPPDTSHRAARWAPVVGWPAGVMPVAPDGFRVSLYADGLQHPRWLHVLPNGDVLVAEANNPGTARDSALPPEALAERVAAGNRGPSADRITLFRDTTGDGLPDVRAVFATGLNRPFGMALIGDAFYVANTDAVVRFRYAADALAVGGAPDVILRLPAGGYNNHWTRNLIARPDGSKLYVTVGSATDAALEGLTADDTLRAAILELAPDGSGARVYASGLRNPNGMDWAPGTGALWAAVNERDGLGEDVPPDYVTSVQDGGFYGWPYAWFGRHVDPRHRDARPDLVARSLAPDYATGAHTATMSIHFYRGRTFPSRFHGGAFIAQRGSWNRSVLSGYQVLFLPFANGEPSGDAEPFLTGFIAADSAGVHGRPVAVAVANDGSLLVTDDASDRVWRVSAE
jgi:glucose/arabinose dehydrogenase